MDTMFMLAIALAIDLTLGEPPNPVHPVAWMGRLASFLEKANVSRSPSVQFVYGMLLTLLLVTLFTVPVVLILPYLKGLSYPAYLVAGGIVLKLAFSLKELNRAAGRVKQLLLDGKLEAARYELRALVSRDTRGLTEPQLVSATVESVAENTSDSFVAPLLYFLLFGVPGAIAYRVVNTLDAVIGYHGKYEYLGKFASRLDDVLNFIPARLTALLFVLASFLSGRNTRSAWQVARGQHARTESPNAGWVMAAVAGAIDGQLEKVGHYRLGNPGIPLTPQVIGDSQNLLRIAALLWGIICFVAGGIGFAITSQA